MVRELLQKIWQLQSNPDRVEKYRPNSMEDVSGHQDIIATINKFVEANVSVLPTMERSPSNDDAAFTSSIVVRTSRHW